MVGIEDLTVGDKGLMDVFMKGRDIRESFPVRFPLMLQEKLADDPIKNAVDMPC